MDILAAVSKLRPGTHWNLRGNILEQCPGEASVITPTWDEINTLILSDSYKSNREAAYPSVGDQLDAIWKGGADFEAMKNKIAEIKLRYPKI